MTAESTSTHQAEQSLHRQRHSNVFMLTGLSTEIKDDQLLQAWPAKSAFVVREIVQTERLYVQSLYEIVQGYVTPLYGSLLSTCGGPNFIQTVFSNVVKLCHLHRDLLQKIQASCYSPENFSRAILETDFSQYNVYCLNYQQSNQYLQKSLAENEFFRLQIEVCQKRLSHTLPLNALLIKPVQRILKYRLLFEELIKHIGSQHPSYKTLEDVLDKMSAVADQINTHLKQPVRQQKLKAGDVAKRRSREVQELQHRRKLGMGRASPPPSEVSSPTPRKSMEVEDMSQPQSVKQLRHYFESMAAATS
ncbi:hypothetical protein EMCRGX_G029524 [Ephydatia muelleri]